MKKIRLEIPLEIWGNLSSNRIWLKCDEDHTEAFEDRKFTKPIQKEEKSIVLYITVPKKLSLIEVIGLGGTTPMDQICINWVMEQANPNWRVPGLKEVTILTKNKIYDIPVINEKPDRNSLDLICNESVMYNLNWAMEVYTFEKETIAALHWHPDLIEEAFDKVKKLKMTKRHKIPCVWEKGGQRGKSGKEKGKATIVCDKYGRPKRAIYVEANPHCCSAHAMIPVKKEDIIIEVRYNGKSSQCDIKLFQIEYINESYNEAEVKLIAGYHSYKRRYIKVEKVREYICEFCYGYWYNKEIAKEYKDAILAAFDKATCNGCKRPYFIKNK